MTFFWSLIQGSALKVGLYLAMTGAVAAVLLGARRAGRNAERVDNLRTILKVKDDQLKAAADRPRSRDDLAERLRADKF